MRNILLAIIATCLVFFVGKSLYKDYQQAKNIDNKKIIACANPKIKNYLNPKVAVDMCEAELNLKYTGKFEG